MTAIYLHGFAGHPSVWDGIMAPGDGEAVALPGHGDGGGDVRPTWAENLDAIAARAEGARVAVGYSL
ncbi:MAG: alpha/beta hydrolase, partial [Deltaproteobacteria bacterium]|nr:alpha/beta hydrolase [Deltaproteobacteria bacterium]